MLQVPVQFVRVGALSLALLAPACDERSSVGTPATAPGNSAATRPTPSGRNIAHWARRQEQGWTYWSEGSITYIDTNADGNPDEEMDDHGRFDDYDFKKDTNFDGVFDVAYHVGFSGVPERARPIEEPVPKVTE